MIRHVARSWPRGRGGGFQGPKVTATQTKKSADLAHFFREEPNSPTKKERNNNIEILRAPDIQRDLMIRGPLMLKGPLIVRGALMIGRALIIRGALLFRRVTDDDWLSLRPLIATGYPNGQRGPNCPDVLFVSFRTDFWQPFFYKNVFSLRAACFQNFHDQPVNLLFDFMIYFTWNVAI